MDILITILGVVLGGGILAFIQFLITRHDNKHDKLKGVTDSIETLKADMNERFDVLDKKIDMVEAKTDENFAISCRVRILRFEDEMQEKKVHSHESWLQVVSDADNYEKFCKDHEGFKNSQTEITIEHIKHGYLERLEKGDWSY